MAQRNRPILEIERWRQSSTLQHAMTGKEGGEGSPATGTFQPSPPPCSEWSLSASATCDRSATHMATDW